MPQLPPGASLGLALGMPNLSNLREPDEIPPGVRYHLLNVLADAKSPAQAVLEALLHHPKKADVVLGDGNVEALFNECYREFITLPSANQSYAHCSLR